MEFDPTRVYTAVNADELPIGAKVLFADTLAGIKGLCAGDCNGVELASIADEAVTNRFGSGTGRYYPLAYRLPEEPKWKKLKVGAVLWKDGQRYLVTGIDTKTTTSLHIFLTDKWIRDDDLDDYSIVYVPEYEDNV